MAFISKVDYRFYKKIYKAAYVISIILLILVLVAGKTINESKRWIYIGSISFQPSELVKFCMIIFFAGLLTKDREELKYFVKGWIYHLLPLIPIAALLLLEPHMSVTMVIGGTILVMMIIAGCKLWQMVIPRYSHWNTCPYCNNNCRTI